SVVTAGCVLLTAHHQDDQAETLLLHLLRGAGPKGLAAMPERTTVEGVLLLRPLLDVSREALHEYARQHDLTWVEDPSNARTEYDRNFLRHEILPRMQTRWPAAGATLTRSARHQAEAALLLEELAEMDLANGGQTPISPAMPISPVMEDVACQHTKKLGSDPHFPLAVSRLLALNPPRRANLLRHWLHLRHAPTPSTAVLERIDRDVVRAAEDAQPLVSWAGVRLRRYRGALFLDDVLEEIDPSYCLEWWVDQPLTLPGGVLSAVHARGEGVAVRHLQAGSVEVRYRQGGESLQPVGRREHHRLKQLFQEAGVPPWERARVPLIYHHDTLIAVAGYWLCEGFQAGVDEPGVRFSWSRAIVPTGSFW
ncbi:MAG: tRNA lysidine(34) synthetase TilS, partial [Gammaproteobacteria bacterium]|nr:tRNA lysidine(34) synthetase TilS [Gammaproteobacteria bacterium]